MGEDQDLDLLTRRGECALIGHEASEMDIKDYHITCICCGDTFAYYNIKSTNWREGGEPKGSFSWMNQPYLTQRLRAAAQSQFKFRQFTEASIPHKKEGYIWVKGKSEE